ncbi:MAG TPA: hypothetical protein VFC65_14065 [Prolixibacteraceae bacterium]|nr:hypothetical protein [Prolixibacteraceae bacterium]
MMDKNYKQFVNKLNDYIRKFYLYRLLRGLILFILLIVSYYSFIAGLEYFNYFDPKVKLFIVTVTAFLTLFIFVYLLLIPFIKLIGIGKRLSYLDVSFRLSKTYPEIKDKLINIVQLANETNSVYSIDLQKASIDQKIEELKIFRFSDAIRFKDLKVVAGIFAGVFLVFSLVYIQLPDFFTQSSFRLIHFQQKYERPAPYTFELENTDLEIVTGESIVLKLHCSGNEIPEMMYVNISGNNFLMTRDEDLFTYTIENVNSSLSVYFTDKRYVSEIFRIIVLNKPFISSFSVDIEPPSYTNLNSETLQNIGDLKIVSGTKLKWIFKTVDTDSLFLILNDSTVIKGKKEGNSFELSKTVYNGLEYRIVVKNSILNDENNMVYRIQTISDLFPEIKVVQIRDTIDFKAFHFKGNIVDDYGFSRLDFNISSEGKDSVIKIPFTPFFLNQDFYYSFNFELVKNFGKSFKYYFSVYDNDFVNHYKRSISETFTFSFPDYKEIISKENSDINSIDQLFAKSAKLTEEIQNEFENFKRKQINSELSEWEKFQTVKDIMSKKTELESVLDQIKQQNKDANNFLNSFSEDKGEILKKQAQIDQLLNEVFSDDLKKLFEEFNELAKQFDSKQFDQLSKQMDSSLDDLSKQLDKNMQLLKKMKVEQKVERVVQELKKLSGLETDLLEKLDKRSDLIQIGKEEMENFSLLKNLEIDYQGALEFNQTLDKPMNIFNFDKEFSKLKENYSTILEDSDKGNKRKTSSGLDNNRKEIDELVFAMDQMLKNNRKKSNEENIEDLKQILDNLIFVSFEQEKLMGKFTSVDYNNPLINDLKVKQKNLQGQVVFIKDSLYSLSERTPAISSVINEEMLGLEKSVNSALDNLESGNIGGSRMYQQYGITAANNLALFLSEALENIKKQQKQMGEGDGDCDKPGGKGSKPGMKNLKESQNSIKEQLQQMIDQMKNGDGSKMSRSIGQTLAQQEIMQQLIRDMINGGSVGSKATAQLKAIDQLLEQSRRDLINKNVTSELINRQNLILSRLLDAEKSEIERDFEDKRESKTAIEIRKENPEGYFEYKKTLKNEKEIIKRSNFKLKSFYDQKYNTFLNQIKN